MSNRKRASKKAKNGYVYEVYFPYKINGITERYSRSGFKTKKEAQEHEALMLAEVKEKGKINKDSAKTLNQVYKEFLELMNIKLILSYVLSCSMKGMLRDS